MSNTANILKIKSYTLTTEYSEISVFMVTSFLNIIKKLHPEFVLSFNLNISNETVDFSIMAEDSYLEKINHYIEKFSLILTKKAPINTIADTEDTTMKVKEILDISALLLRLHFSQLPYNTETSQFEAAHQFIEDFHNNLGQNLFSINLNTNTKKHEFV